MEESQTQTFYFKAEESGYYYISLSGEGYLDDYDWDSDYGDLGEGEYIDYLSVYFDVYKYENDDSTIDKSIRKWMNRGEVIVIDLNGYDIYGDAELNLEVKSPSKVRYIDEIDDDVIAKSGTTTTLKPDFILYDGFENKIGTVDESKAVYEWYDDFGRTLGTNKEIKVSVNSKEYENYTCRIDYEGIVGYAYYSVYASDYLDYSLSVYKFQSGNKISLEPRFTAKDVYGNVTVLDITKYPVKWYLDYDYSDSTKPIGTTSNLLVSNPNNQTEYYCTVQLTPNQSYGSTVYVYPICSKHDFYSSGYFAATCTEPAYGLKCCNDCEIYTKTVIGLALGHDYKASGTTMRCSRCGDSYATNKESTVVPSKVTGLKASNIKSKTIKLSWKKAANAKSYKIQYSTNKKFKKAKIKITTKTSYKIKKLKKGKTYYVRVRGVNGSALSPWTKAKKIKIKK